MIIKKKAKVNRYFELYNSFPRISYVDKTSKTRLRWIKATMRLIVNGKATECYPMNINDVRQPLYTYILIFTYIKRYYISDQQKQ